MNFASQTIDHEASSASVACRESPTSVIERLRIHCLPQQPIAMRLRTPSPAVDDGARFSVNSSTEIRPIAARRSPSRCALRYASCRGPASA
jgi:hypothetical protein